MRRFLLSEGIAGIIVLLCSIAQAQSFVNSNECGGSPVSTITCTSTNPFHASTLAVAIVSGQINTITSGPISGLGLTYTLAISQSDGGTGGTKIYYSETGATSGTESITFNWSGNCIECYVFVIDIQGLATSSPVDVANGTVNNPSTGQNQQVSFTTTQANDFAIAATWQYSAGGISGNWTGAASVPGFFPGGIDHVTQYKPNVTTGSNTATSTSNSAPGAGWAMAVVAFKVNNSQSRNHAYVF